MKYKGQSSMSRSGVAMATASRTPVWYKQMHQELVQRPPNNRQPVNRSPVQILVATSGLQVHARRVRTPCGITVYRCDFIEQDQARRGKPM